MRFILKEASCEKNAYEELFLFIQNSKVISDSCCIKIAVKSFAREPFFKACSGLPRLYFKSRDIDFELCGLAIAHKLQSLADLRYELDEDQFYMGGLRFAPQKQPSSEWQGFDETFLILPLLQVIKRNNNIMIVINFNKNFINLNTWRDHILSILKSLSIYQNNYKPAFLGALEEERPSFAHYAASIAYAQNFFKSHKKSRKVVLGRRNSYRIKGDILSLFFNFASYNTGFAFFLDAALGGGLFFGISPELLYRRMQSLLESESLAGTRLYSPNKQENDRLITELFTSSKEHREHALVCEYIEERLLNFGISNLYVSPLEIRSLAFVQHLIKRYRGHINADLSDYYILNALHPTPAVCGLDPLWAREFIQRHEGFDRGFYAGPVGYVGKKQAEFAVAIRSALAWRDTLHVYAASGIVHESNAQEEWEELSSKQKNIMSMFS